MALHTFDVTAFRAAFPAFADPLAYPDPVLQMYWNTATAYCNANDWYNIQGDTLQTILNYFTAHIAQLATVVAQGLLPGFIQNATIDAVTVALAPPPEVNQFQWWMNQTTYGQSVLALLQAVTVGGFFFGGLPETSAFRKVGGIF